VKLTCADTEACLVDVSDGRLNPSLEMRVYSHLEECAHCRERADLWWALVPRLRSLSPRPPVELGARRMEVAVLRSLQAHGSIEVRPGRRWRSAAAAVVLVTAAAALVLWLRMGQPAPRPGDGGYALITRISGVVTSGGQLLAVEASLPFGSGLEVAAGGEAELRMDRGTVLQLRGPAQLAFQGTTREVLLRLETGTLQAEVAHRLPGETFAVWVRDLSVRVRGTRFVVETGSAGSAVRVQEGSVAVELANGSTQLLRAGEQVTTAPTIGLPAPPAPPSTSAAVPALEVPPAGSPPALSCLAAVRRCEGTAHAVRARMRDGGDEGALRLLSGASRLAREVAPACAREISPCGDELGYLLAEALHASGRIDEAVGAYVALNRPTAPTAMRQNALYAAAELERRRGRTRVARRYYESALAVAPKGALREEALIGSMESASATGDGDHAEALARTYLFEFPDGHANASARRLLGAGPGATGNGPAGH
jgi:ferric-dicitrate binding protein FerR (iron transport regulator)